MLWWLFTVCAELGLSPGCCAPAPGPGLCSETRHTFPHHCHFPGSPVPSVFPWLLGSVWLLLSDAAWRGFTLFIFFFWTQAGFSHGLYFPFADSFEPSLEGLFHIFVPWLFTLHWAIFPIFLWKSGLPETISTSSSFLDHRVSDFLLIPFCREKSVFAKPDPSIRGLLGTALALTPVSCHPQFLHV